MKKLKIFGQYIAPDGTLLLANTNDPEDPVGIEAGLIASLDNLDQYKNSDLSEMGEFNNLRKLKPGHIFGYNVKPNGYAYAERFTGEISLCSRDESYDVTHAAPAQLAVFLTTPALADFHFFSSGRYMDSVPSFHIDDLVEYDQDFWKSELADLNL